MSRITEEISGMGRGQKSIAPSPIMSTRHLDHDPSGGREEAEVLDARVRLVYVEQWYRKLWR